MNDTVPKELAKIAKGELPHNEASKKAQEHYDSYEINGAQLPEKPGLSRLTKALANLGKNRKPDGSDAE